ncbi:HD domain-containing protein [Conexibacter sp. S30A1]|uniref:HD domain-containing protein n=1 Tax=Conexibacter sp. S30A1 TaxID=2937800 RepID=UPI00200EEACE|nr:HD domain-containing protein [Conexibacter sp. S30A1]
MTAEGNPPSREATPLTGRFDQALAYAAEVHRNQFRKGTTIPYLSHLLAVCGLVLEDGGDEDEAIAALLHDAPEDQGGRERLAEIRTRFGERVATIVEACSDTFETDKEDWRVRKERYLDHLRVETDQGVLRVSLADKLANARSLLRDQLQQGDTHWNRFHAPRHDQRWYYTSLATVFQERANGPMARELNDTVTRLFAI